MRRRNESRVKATILFMVLALFFIGTTSVLAIKLPNKIGELNELKESLSVAEDTSKELAATVEEVAGVLKGIQDEIKQIQQELEEAKKENPELSKALEGEELKYAYLTFDDGPSDNTLKILDFLKANNLKATFFVIGKENQDEVYKRIVDEGHTLALHSDTHKYDEIYTSVDSFMKDIHTLSDRLEKITGVRADILRFPGGSNNTISRKYGGKDLMDKIIEKVSGENIAYFDWNVDSMDASATRQDKNVIVNSILQGAAGKKHAIILMHDAPAKTTTVDALPEIIEGLRKQGFVFEKITNETHPVQFK